jgi:hypothetical protein
MVQGRAKASHPQRHSALIDKECLNGTHITTHDSIHRISKTESRELPIRAKSGVFLG